MVSRALPREETLSGSEKQPKNEEPSNKSSEVSLINRSGKSVAALHIPRCF